MSQRYTNSQERGRQVGFREPYLDRRDAYYAGSRQGPPPQRQQGRKISSATKVYKKEKEERFRKEKGAEVLNTYHAELKKSLLCGFESMEDVLKAKEYENTSRSVALPVSTRAVGISVVNTYNKVTQTEANRQRMPNVSIHQIYRVMLAMVERKIFDNRISATLDDRTEWYDPSAFEDFKSVITSINICTQQIGALLRCIPCFKYDEVNFVPLFPANQFDGQRRLLPLPEVVTFSNLRDTVTSLANQQIPLAVRRNFINKNPIPGAIFDNNILTNADAIIPANYHAQDLRDDLYAVKGWIEAASDLRNAREKWFTKISPSELQHGNESVLVSSNSETLRITVHDGRSVVEGDIEEFWFRSRMSDQMIFFGTYHLAGENASIARYLYPGYCTRAKAASGMTTKRSFKEVVLAIEA